MQDKTTQAEHMHTLPTADLSAQQRAYSTHTHTHTHTHTRTQTHAHKHTRTHDLSNVKM